MEDKVAFEDREYLPTDGVVLDYTARKAVSGMKDRTGCHAQLNPPPPPGTMLELKQVNRKKKKQE